MRQQGATLTPMHPLRRALPYVYAFWLVVGLVWAACEYLLVNFNA